MQRYINLIQQQLEDLQVRNSQFLQAEGGYGVKREYFNKKNHINVQQMTNNIL